MSQEELFNAHLKILKDSVWDPAPLYQLPESLDKPNDGVNIIIRL